MDLKEQSLEDLSSKLESLNGLNLNQENLNEVEIPIRAEEINPRLPSILKKGWFRILKVVMETLGTTTNYRVYVKGGIGASVLNELSTIPEFVSVETSSLPVYLLFTK